MSKLKHVVSTTRAPAPFQGAPYSQGIIFGDLVFVAGQIALDPETYTVVEGGIEEQTERVMQNLSAILEEAGSGLKQLVKTTIFLADFDDFTAVNEVYGRHVGPEPPARATVQVAYLPSGVLVEIDAIAHL
jgi:2-iminobutanoate/2-iminopropanoate deaminase